MSTEPTRLRMGLYGIVRLDLVPRLECEFEPLEPKRRGDFLMDVPVRGKCRNLSADTPCVLTWLDDEDKAKSSTRGMMKMNGDDFHVEVAGANPTVDLIGDRLFGKGSLGCRLHLDFPHADPFDTPADKRWRFDHPLDVKPDRTGRLEFGSKVVFEPEVARVFDKAEILLQLFEIDEGDEEIGTGAGVGSITWEEDRDEREWRVGFVPGSDSAETLYFERHESGPYEFGYIASIRYLRDLDNKVYVEQTFKDERGPAFIAKQPALEIFRVEFEKEGVRLRDRVTAVGRVANLASGCSIPLDVALVHQDSLGRAPPDRWPRRTVRAEFDDDGRFEATLFNRWAWRSDPLPDSRRTFAILSATPAIGQTEGFVATADVLDYDEDALLPIEQGYLVSKHGASWVCSAEALRETRLARHLIDNADVKRVLYPLGKVNSSVHESLKKLLTGEVPDSQAPRKGRCKRATARALQRALVFLGYPTSWTGACGVDGDLGSGTNKAIAFFVREHATELLWDDKGGEIADEVLLSDAGLQGKLPTVVLDQVRLEVLILAVGLSMERRHVWFGNFTAALESLEAIDSKSGDMPMDQVVRRYRPAIEAAVKYGIGKGLRVTSAWLAALIATQSGGRFRPKLDNGALRKYYTRETIGGVFGDDGNLQNMMECRLRSTRFGLANRTGSDQSLTSAGSAFDLCHGSTEELVRWIVDVLLEHREACGVVEQEKADEITLPRVRKLAAAFTGDARKARALLESHAAAAAGLSREI